MPCKVASESLREGEGMASIAGVNVDADWNSFTCFMIGRSRSRWFDCLWALLTSPVLVGTVGYLFTWLFSFAFLSFVDQRQVLLKASLVIHEPTVGKYFAMKLKQNRKSGFKILDAMTIGSDPTSRDGILTLRSLGYSTLAGINLPWLGSESVNSLCVFSHLMEQSSLKHRIYILRPSARLVDRKEVRTIHSSVKTARLPGDQLALLVTIPLETEDLEDEGMFILPSVRHGDFLHDKSALDDVGNWNGMIIWIHPGPWHKMSGLDFTTHGRAEFSNARLLSIIYSSRLLQCLCKHVPLDGIASANRYHFSSTSVYMVMLLVIHE